MEKLTPYLSNNLSKLKHLDLQGTKIKEISFAEGVCPNLQHLNISCFEKLVKVEVFAFITNITVLARKFPSTSAGVTN